MAPEEVLARLRDWPAPLAFTPLGQDGFLAADFAGRFETVARAVRGVRGAIAAVRGDDRPVTDGPPDSAAGRLAAAASAVLSADSPFARAFGLRRPVAQGPMTRVSDTPGFARAVADDGALPFLALALADRAEQVQTVPGEPRTPGPVKLADGVLDTFVRQAPRLK